MVKMQSLTQITIEEGFKKKTFTNYIIKFMPKAAQNETKISL